MTRRIVIPRAACCIVLVTGISVGVELATLPPLVLMHYLCVVNVLFMILIPGSVFLFIDQTDALFRDIYTGIKILILMHQFTGLLS